MASITLTIPAGDATRILDGFATHHKYQTDVANPLYDPADAESTEPETIPNPESKVEFAKRKIIEFVKASVKAEETRVALEAARGAMASDPTIT